MSRAQPTVIEVPIKYGTEAYYDDLEERQKALQEQLEEIYDEPFDPMNIRRNGPGIAVVGAHGPSYLVNEPGRGLISRIFPVQIIWTQKCNACSVTR